MTIEQKGVNDSGVPQLEPVELGTSSDHDQFVLSNFICFLGGERQCAARDDVRGKMSFERRCRVVPNL